MGPLDHDDFAIGPKTHNRVRRLFDLRGSRFPSSSDNVWGCTMAPSDDTKLQRIDGSSIDLDFLRTFTGVRLHEALDVLQDGDHPAHDQLPPDAVFSVPGRPDRRWRIRDSIIPTASCEELVASNVLVPAPYQPPSVFAFRVFESWKDPPRFRPIFDTLLSNAWAIEAPLVSFASITALRHMLAASPPAAICISYDFRSWYWQLCLSPAAGDRYVIRTRDGNCYALRRMAMGHKWAVFVSHEISSSLARAALAGFENTTQFDVIIDNVIFIGPPADVRAVGAKFESLCALANAKIGDRVESSTLFDHRGVSFNLVDKSVGLKKSWLTKLRHRWATANVTAPSPHITFARLRSLAGMLSWGRSVIGRLPPTFYFWKQLARATAMSLKPSATIKLAPSTIMQMTEAIEFLLSDPRSSPSHDSTDGWVVFSDAMKAYPFAAWGAVAYNERTGEIIDASGSWFESTLHITALETYAAAEALLAFKHKLDKSSSAHTVNLEIFIDASASVAAITHGCSPSWAMDTAARHVLRVAASLNRSLRVFHIPGVLNPADEPSRQAQVDFEKIKAFRRRRVGGRPGTLSSCSGPTEALRN